MKTYTLEHDGCLFNMMDENGMLCGCIHENQMPSHAPDKIHVLEPTDYDDRWVYVGADGTVYSQTATGGYTISVDMAKTSDHTALTQFRRGGVLG